MSEIDTKKYTVNRSELLCDISAAEPTMRQFGRVARMMQRSDARGNWAVYSLGAHCAQYCEAIAMGRAHRAYQCVIQAHIAFENLPSKIGAKPGGASK